MHTRRTRAVSFQAFQRAHASKTWPASPAIRRRDCFRDYVVDSVTGAGIEQVVRHEARARADGLMCAYALIGASWSLYDFYRDDSRASTLLSFV
jgi:hypothetical protein